MKREDYVKTLFHLYKSFFITMYFDYKPFNLYPFCQYKLSHFSILTFINFYYLIIYIDNRLIKVAIIHCKFFQNKMDYECFENSQSVIFCSVLNFIEFH
jgi:hypothetical protein